MNGTFHCLSLVPPSVLFFLNETVSFWPMFPCCSLKSLTWHFVWSRLMSLPEKVFVSALGFKGDFIWENPDSVCSPRHTALNLAFFSLSLLLWRNYCSSYLGLLVDEWGFIFSLPSRRTRPLSVAWNKIPPSESFCLFCLCSLSFLGLRSGD